MKVMTIVGTRPELIRLSRIIPLFDKLFDHVLVHTGQNYDFELNEIFFQDLELRKPDHFLNAAGSNAAETIAQTIERSDKIFDLVKPDALLILGDTNSGLCVIPAKRRHIPIFHMEAGNRCFDFRVPEEINRRVIDHLSDINLPYTENARRNLSAEGLPSEQIFVTGSPQLEVLQHFLPQIEKSEVLDRLKLESKNYFVASFHREENVDSPNRMELLIASLNAIAEKYDKKIVLTVHPRTRAKLDNSNTPLDKRVIDVKPLGFFDYVFLQQNSICTLSDSGTITEESAMLNFPAITLRDTHERQEGTDVGTLVMSGIDPDSVLGALNLAIESHKQMGSTPCPAEYGVESVSWTVAKIVQGYVPFVRRKTLGV
jgi:UDP-N-acetylglucosamine 2-epimerase (non-hydrolysing)